MNGMETLSHWAKPSPLPFSLQIPGPNVRLILVQYDWPHSSRVFALDLSHSYVVSSHSQSLPHNWRGVFLVRDQC